MTAPNDDTEIDDSAGNPLAPLFERAARGAAIERAGTSPVRVTLIDDEWLLLADGDAELAEHGQWIASDTFLELAEEH